MTEVQRTPLNPLHPLEARDPAVRQAAVTAALPAIVRAAPAGPARCVTGRDAAATDRSAGAFRCPVFRMRARPAR